MAIFDTGNVAPQKPGSSLDVALTEMFRFPQFAEPLAYKHSPTLPQLDVADLAIPCGCFVRCRGKRGGNG